MATQKQLIANRNNASKSTGPKTQKGKALASQNSLKHGLFTAENVINEESKDAFDLHQEQMLAELAPQGPTELLLAERIITLSWRLSRINRFRTETINDLQNPTKSPLQKLLRSINQPTCPEPVEGRPAQTTSATKTSRMIIKDFNNGKVLERLLMYERRIENSLYRTMNEYQRLKLIKQLNHAEPNQPQPLLRTV
jgi:hypothetical protein